MAKIKDRFRPRTSEENNDTPPERILTQEPIAVYYRQSTTAQVGNISTSMQTIDMVEELIRRGWNKEDIILIDDDEGVSGATRIDEREGMSYLFELITERKIGALACQDEDRLFRDMTQIQVNIFIDICRKADVKVVTPYFIYDFAHPVHGEFHARQFRFKCEMAAEYLKSYVLGRLYPARQRLLREGRWAGAKMPVGYMVDMRKQLANGAENPQWRRFIPFEPYAEIVRAYFQTFLECNGAIRKTMRSIQEKGLSFPNCKPPEGFKISYQLKDRGDGFFVNRGNLVTMLTNPVYMGHWMYQGEIVRWDNHAPIIDQSTFMQVFNMLSTVTLTGEANPDYSPAYQHNRPKRDVERPTEQPLLTGLLYTQIGDRWLRTGCVFEKRNACYLYAQYRTELEGAVMEWARRCQWIDEAIVSSFRKKLRATFDSNAWAQAITETELLIERDRKLKRTQLESLTESMQNLVLSLKTLTHPYLIREVEQRYSQMEQEHQRLEREIAALNQKSAHHISLQDAYALFDRAVAEWDSMTQDERRRLLHLFIERIEAYDYNRMGDMTLRVHWKDGQSEEVRSWHKSHSEHWNHENATLLLELFDAGKTQLEIAAAFPKLKWYQIFNELKKHRGLVRFTPSWLGKQETYEDYVASGGRKGKASGSYWREEEIAILKEMVECQATQLEIMREFPYRRWVQIKCRIKEVFGKGVTVPLSGISQRMTYIEYAQENGIVDDECNSETVGRNCGWRHARARGFPSPRYPAVPRW